VPVYQDVLAWDVFELGALNPGLRVAFLPTKSDTFLVSAMLKNVDLIADWLNLSATNYLGIRRDCCAISERTVVGSSLLGPPSLLLDCDRGKRVSNFVRSGNKVFWPLVLDSVSTARESVPLRAVESIQSWSMKNSQCRKLAPFWRSLVRTVAASA